MRRATTQKNVLPIACALRRVTWGSAVLISFVLGCGDDSDTSTTTTSSGGGGPLVVTPAPGGMRRLTTAQLVNGVEDTLGSEAAGLIPPTRDQQLHGFEAIWSAEIAFTPNEVTGLEDRFSDLIDAALDAPDRLVALAPCIAAPTDACFAEVATAIGRQAWRRTLRPEEVQKLVAIGQAAKAWGVTVEAEQPYLTGIKYELLAILQSPNFLYVPELGEMDSTSGHRRLTPLELASRMAYFFTNRGPDRQLLDAAEQGGLDSPDAVRAQSVRLLQSPSAFWAMRRFFNELYLIRDLANTEKDPTLFPEYTAEIAAKLQEQLLLFIDDLIWTRNGDTRDLFDSPDMFVDATLAAFYGISAPGEGFQRVTMSPESKRAGILGHAAFLARFAHPGQTSPTRRGRFIQERLACRTIDPPPPGQATDIPEEQPGVPQTMREKLTVHMAQGTCGGCHGLMDPLGFALENFDAVGKYRDLDRGLTIDTTGETKALGKFTDGVTLGQNLRASKEASACFVRNLFRNGLAHVETEGEEDAVLALEKVFAERGYSLQELMIEFSVNPVFYLVGEPK